MKKILLLTFLLSSVFVSSYSQNVGYLGKRLIINADLTLTPTLKAPNFNGNSHLWAFNYIFSPNIEVIAHRRGTVGALFNYYTTKCNTVPDMGIGYEFQNDNSTEQRDLVDLKIIGGGIFYKLYVGNPSIAPLGNYFKFQFDYLHYAQTNSIDDLNPVKDYMFGLRVEYGRDFLFWNFLKINFAFTIGLTSSGYSDTSFNNAEIEKLVERRILKSYIVGTKVGIGILPF